MPFQQKAPDYFIKRSSRPIREVPFPKRQRFESGLMKPGRNLKIENPILFLLPLGRGGLRWGVRNNVAPSLPPLPLREGRFLMEANDEIWSDELPH